MLVRVVCLALLVGSAIAATSVKDEVFKLSRRLSNKDISHEDLLDHSLVRQKLISMHLRKESGQVMVEVRGLFSGSDGFKNLIELGCVVNEFWANRKVFVGACPLEAMDNPEIAHVESYTFPAKAKKSVYESVSEFYGPMVDPEEYSDAGEGAIVQVIDTGVDVFHSDFEAYDGSSSTRVTLYTRNFGDASMDYSGTAEDVCTWAPCDTDGHGTHVASTAAGRFGVAPKAEIWASEIDFSWVSISNAMIAGVQAAQLTGKPISINLSLGTDYHTHTGMNDISYLIYSLTHDENDEEIPGVAIVVAAGNSADNLAHQGFFVEGGESQTFELEVEAYGYFADEYLACVLATLPTSLDWEFTVATDYWVFSDIYNANATETNFEYIMDVDGEHFGVMICLTGELMVGMNNLPMNITVRNLGSEGSAVHSWLLPESGTVYGWEGDEFMSTSGLCASPYSICVGAYTTKTSFDHEFASEGEQIPYPNDVVGTATSFSSRGPVAFSERFNENGTVYSGVDVSAPGLNIVAALSGQVDMSSMYRYLAKNYELSPGDCHARYVGFSGTSMASPHVAGGVAALLSIDPSLTYSEVRELLGYTAKLDDTMVTPLEVGMGIVDMGAAVEMLMDNIPEPECMTGTIPVSSLGAIGVKPSLDNICLESLFGAMGDEADEVERDGMGGDIRDIPLKSRNM